MILLLENRRDRVGGIEEININFDKYKNIEVILYDDNCNHILDKFLENNNQFSKYDTIIIHESIYDDNRRDELFKVLKEFCLDKKLIIFSGYHPQASLSNNTLTLTPKKLYENLDTFLKEYKNDNSNILMLSYGKDWDLNPLCNYLEKLNIFIETLDKNNKYRSAKFKKDFGLFELQKILKEEEYQSLYKNLDFGYEVSIEEMKILSYNFKTLIQEKAKR